MSSWWGLKYGRSKGVNDSVKDSFVKKEKKIGKENEKQPKNTEAVLLSQSSPRNSKDFSVSEDDFSGFPLPTALESSDDQCFVRGVFWFGSGSRPDSSVSSSGSSDDHARVDLDLAAARGHEENKLRPVLRSQGQDSMGTKVISSRHNSHFSSDHFDSSTKKIDAGKGECHRLPLPPGSPYRPSVSQVPRSPRAESSSKWRKGKFIRRCSSGPLFLGFNIEHGKMCTIKEVAFSDDKSSRKCLDQLNQEKTLLSQLSHVNIVQYYGFELRGKKLSIYLEYISGGSILKLLQEYGPLGELVVQSYTRQVLSALVYLHGRNTVHRNIRAENLVVGLNGDIRLVDFGMAKNINSSSSVPLLKGNLHWMAPEVVMDANAYNFAADIWSLGCTIIELATSKPPWSQYEGVAAVYKIGKCKDTPEIPNLSADAKSFLRLCLQREPSARPTAKQLLNHPFVRNQTTLTVINTNNITREAFSHTSKGNHTQSAPELQYSGMGDSSFQQSKRMHGFFYRPDPSKVTIPRTLIIPRNSTRTTTSLPVPPSIPVLNDGAQSNKSSVSPSHPSYTFDGQNNQNRTDSSTISLRPKSRSTLDPWFDIPQFKAVTPVRSPTITIS